MSAHVRVFLLFLIVGMGAAVRFSHITDRGPSFFDEGVYTLEGRWIYSFSKALHAAAKRKIEEVRKRQNIYAFEEEAQRFAQRLEGEPPVWGRPGFSFLTGVCMFLFGPTVRASHLVSALFGTLAILAVYVLGASMFDKRIGLVSALLLALSGYHLVYSYTGLADGPAMCSSIFGFYFYYKSAKYRAANKLVAASRSMLVAGLFSGIAFTIHDRFLYLVGIIVLNEMFDVVRKRLPLGNAGWRMVVFSVGFIIPLGMCELPYYLGMVFLRHFGKVLPFRTYFEELFTHHVSNFVQAFAGPFLDLRQYPMFKDVGSRWYNLLTYPYLFWKLNGLLFLSMWVLGTAVAVLRRRYEDRLLLVWLVVPCSILSTGLAASVRYALVFLPAGVLLAALSIELIQWLLTRTGITSRQVKGSAWIVFVLALSASMWFASAEIRGLRCSFDEPAAFLSAHGCRHISTSYPVSKAYLGVKNVMEPPENYEQLEEYYRAGYKYFVTDYRRFFLTPPFDTSERGRIIEDIESTISPVFTSVNACYAAPCYIFELNVFFTYTLKLVRQARQMGVDQIRIYDLDDYFSHMHTRKQQ